MKEVGEYDLPGAEGDGREGEGVAADHEFSMFIDPFVSGGDNCFQGEIEPETIEYGECDLRGE